MPSLLPQLQSSPYPLQEIYEALRLEVWEHKEDFVNALGLVGVSKRMS